MTLALLARHWKLIGSALVAALLLGVIAWRGHRIHTLEGALTVLAGKAQNVVLALRDASGNDAVTLDTAPGQAIALGVSVARLKLAVVEQNASIAEMAREAVRLKAEAAELKRIADKARAQRASALRRLSDMAITSGTRDDCMTLLREAEEALDLVREAGA